MFATPSSVAGDMLESTDDYLPERWHEKYRAIVGEWTGERSVNGLQKWLEEIYFDSGKRQYFTRQDIVKVGKIVSSLLRFEPSERASADEVLRDPWFEDELSCEVKLLKLHDGFGKSSSGNVSKPQVASLRPKFSQLSLRKGGVTN
jgi:serine/threonine protein kinase